MAPRARIALLTAVLTAGCDHPAPFRPGAYVPGGPFQIGAIVRITFNPGRDRAPTWLPGGAGIVYSAERLDRLDHDHCLAELPAAGGTIRRYDCRTTAADDSINAFEDAAVSSDGRVAYVRAAAYRLPEPPLTPDAQALVLARLADVNDVRVLRRIAYTAPSRRIHHAVSHVGWLGPSRLVYLGESVSYPRACSSCDPDTVRTGIEVVTLDFDAPTPLLAVVPGTDGASSVTVGATGDTIYFTRNGDSRVYRRAFSGGQTDTVYDFGAAGIARDVAVANGRLVAVVGGDVAYIVDSVLGNSQVDHGGELHFVTLATGAETVVGDFMSRFRRPALAPDGMRVVAESRATFRADLWLVEAP